MPISPARLLAFDVLRKVDAGGYASDLLLRRGQEVEERDRALAGEIVLGCLRRQAQLDYAISLRAPRKLDLEVRLALRMGLYQLRHLDRVPRHAAVSESVELVKRARKASAAGLVNAVLRAAGGNDPQWPDRATALSVPAWLLSKWDRQFGVETADAIGQAFLKPVESYLASTGRTQDIGAQSIVPLLKPSPGLTFLDLCAAPGNKTAQAIESGMEAVACDIHPHRLAALSDLNCRRVVLDGTQPLPFSQKFDRVLVDAPCSGTGTLGRNPEIKWRLRPESLQDLQKVQIGLLRRGLEALRDGGTLVYATCSLEAEENEDVIAQVNANWTVYRRIPGREEGDGFFSAVLVS